MAKPTEPTFYLKCIRGHKEQRPAAACKGEQPMCKTCYMPMVMEKVKIP